MSDQQAEIAFLTGAVSALRDQVHALREREKLHHQALALLIAGNALAATRLWARGMAEFVGVAPTGSADR